MQSLRIVKWCFRVIAALGAALMIFGLSWSIWAIIIGAVLGFGGLVAWCLIEIFVDRRHSVQRTQPGGLTRVDKSDS